MSKVSTTIIYEGQMLNVLAIDEMADEFICPKETLIDKMKTKLKLREKTVTEKQMTRLIKAIGDVGKIWNKEKFRKPDISKCKKIWEFKPGQTRYFAIFNRGEIIIFDKRIKKCQSLPQPEYDSICQKAKNMGLED